jgi:precorrin-3B methylase
LFPFSPLLLSGTKCHISATAAAAVMILVPNDVFSLALSGDVNIFAVAAAVAEKIEKNRMWIPCKNGKW